MARPVLPDDRRRDAKPLRVRLTEREKYQVCEAARARGLDVSKLIRQLLHEAGIIDSG